MTAPKYTLIAGLALHVSNGMCRDPDLLVGGILLRTQAGDAIRQGDRYLTHY